MIRRFILITTALFALSIPTAAQEATSTFTTSGGLTVTHPASWEPQETNQQGFVIADTDSGMQIYVEFGEAAVAQFGGTGALTSAGDALELLLGFWAEAGGTADESLQTSVTLANGEALLQPAISPFGTHTLMVAFNLSDGQIMLALAGNENTEDEISAALQTEILDILGTLTLDESAVFEDPATMEDPTAEPEVYIPEGAVIVADLPEGVVRFSSGAEIQYPEGWKLYAPDPYIQNSTSLLYGESVLDYSAMMVITVNEFTTFPIEAHRQAVLPMTAMLFTGQEEFDLATGLVTETLEDDREFEYLAIPEDAPINGNSFTVTLDDQYWANFLVTVVVNNEFAPDRMAEAEAIARSIVLVEPEPVLNADGSIAEVVTAADCYTYARNAEADVWLFDCPAGCADEGGSVWGTDIYTDDSSVCVAAVHAGVITNADGGVVQVTLMPGQESYAASELNGVSTSEYGAWGASFSVATPPQP